MMQDHCFANLQKDIAAGKVVTITGTGVSVAACDAQTVKASGIQYPVAAWTGLLKHGVDYCLSKGRIDSKTRDLLHANLDSGRVTLIIAVAQEVVKAMGGQDDGDFAEWLNMTVGQLKATKPEVIEVLHAFPGLLATLNYDGLIEDVTQRQAITWQQKPRFEKAKRAGSTNAVLHLHGWFEEPISVVLDFQSYYAVSSDAYIQGVLRGWATDKTLFFVGCGDTVNDPNFSKLVEWGNAVFANVPRPHAVLCRAEQLDAFRETYKPAKWLNILTYDGGYAGLAPFLRRLHAPPARATIAPTESVIPAVYPSTDEDSFLSIKSITYINWLIDAKKDITLHGIPGFGSVPLPLDTAYVPLQALPAPTAPKAKGRAQAVEKETKPEDISFNEVLSEKVLGKSRHLAIIGGAGSGKSTVLQNIAWALALARKDGDAALARTKTGLVSTPDALPVPVMAPLVALAKIRRERMNAAHEKHNERDDLVSLIDQALQDEKAPVPGNYFRSLYASKRNIILLLDGLDEVSDTDDRERFREKVDQLARARNGMSVVVSCRTVAYVNNATLRADFRVVNVLPLDRKKHVEPLVRKAYGAIYSRPEQADDCSASAKDLIDGIAALETSRHARLGADYQALVDSPLMVRVLLIVHMGPEGRLPDGRAELFEKAVEVLLSADYGERGIDVRDALSQDWRLHRRMLQHLAFHMHQQRDAQNAGSADREAGVGITEKGVNDAFAPLPEFAAQAASLMSNAHDRATVLQEVAGKYRFIHLAFQEFLAARYLCEVVGQSSEQSEPLIVSKLEPRLHDSWWREVILLVAGYKAFKPPKSADDFLHALAAAGARPDAVFAANELAATASLEIGQADTTGLRAQCAQRINGLLGEKAALETSNAVIRVRAGNALSRLGDPRFNAQYFYLPADENLGFVKIDADPDFRIGTRSAHAQKVKKATGYAADKYEINDAVKPTPTEAFYIARYPVTVAQFRAFIDAKKAVDANFKIGDNDTLRGPGNHPVQSVNLHEALQYCEWLQAQLLYKKVFKNNELRNILQQGWQITLPSELEWETAARGGKRDLVFPWGDDADANRANYDDTKIGGTSPVGCFAPNHYGLYDMVGNVWEWTRSLWGKDSGKSAFGYPYDAARMAERENLEAPDDVLRVLRGGSWFNVASFARCAVRLRLVPDFRNYYFGFRVVLRSPLL